MLFEGGPDVAFFNACHFVLLPYIAFCFHSVGAAFLARPMGIPLGALDLAIFRTLAGAGIVSILGVALGSIWLLTPWVTVPIFLGIIFLGSLRLEALPLRAAPVGPPLLRLVSTLLTVATITVLGYIVITKGLLLDVWCLDVPQHYYAYLNEVRYHHGIWMDPGKPMSWSFIAGHGNGVHIFLASFMSAYVGQLVSIIYFLLLALMGRQACVSVLNRAPTVMRRLGPPSALLLALASNALVMDFGKYHMQTATLLVGLGWGSLWLLSAEGVATRWLVRALAPLAVALPMSQAQYEAFACVTLAFVGTVTLCVRGWRLARVCVGI
ncbi:hypothetical protein HY251_05055, partial [bacterium]|nr:hypothetical protein [bacterium]